MIKGYCRVTTKSQLEGNNLEDQERTILIHYPDAIIYKEQYNIAKKDRTIFIKLTDELKNGNTLVVATLNRFCRTTKEALETIDKFFNS